MLTTSAGGQVNRRTVGLDPAAGLAGFLVVAGTALLAWEARGATFSGDDWSFVLHRRGLSASVLLTPHNEHLSSLPILVYKLLLAVFGAGSYAPFMAVLLALHATVCLLLYAIARRYVGAWAALVPTSILVVLGPAWQDLLWAFQMAYVGSVAAGLGMILCLERRGRGADLAAGTLLGVALLSSSVGLALIPLAAVLIALARPRTWRRLWLVAVPGAMYTVWWAVYGVATARADNLPRAPGYVFDALAAGVASVTGLGQTHRSPFLVATTLGGLVAVAVVIWLVVDLVRGGRPGPLTWAALLAALVLWSAEAIEYFPNGREAAQSRYQYGAAVLILLATVPAVAGRRASPRWAGILAVITLAICTANLVILHSRVGFWTQNAAFARTEEGALTLERGVVRASFAPENAFTIALVGNHNLGVITAGPYFSAVNAFGSDAYTAAQIRGRPEDEREAADVVLVFGERLHLVPASRAEVARCRSNPAGTVTATRAAGVLTVHNPGRSAARLQLRRFGARYRLPPFSIPPRATVRLTFPADGTTLPWQARAVGTPRVALCA